MYRPLASAFKSWAQLVVVISSVCAPLLPLHPEHAVSDSGLVHLKHHMGMDVRVVESMTMAIAAGSEDGNHDRGSNQQREDQISKNHNLKGNESKLKYFYSKVINLDKSEQITFIPRNLIIYTH